MKRKPSINVLVRDKYTKSIEGRFSLEEPLILSFVGKKRNLNKDLEVIEDALKSKVDPIILDLYNIALIVYVWDLQIERTGLRPRYSSILMSVSDKEKWDSVKSHLEGTLRFLTGDTYNFHFVQGKSVRRKFKFRKKKSGKCVALFSGGLDSLAGVKWMIEREIEPVLISHPGMGLISSAQKELVSSLKKMTKKGLTWHQVRATARPGSDLTAKEYTQFSRSFLYLTLGIIFALKLGIGKEYIFENGIIALNIPLTQSRIYNNTRTVHPQFIAMYQELLNSLFGQYVTVENPFSTMTKGEVIKLLDSNGFRDLVKMTISCPNVTPLRWKGVSIRKTRHCGVCYPCIIRRAATHYANLWNNDALYAQDITTEYSKIPEEGRKLIFEMMDFSRQIERIPTVYEAFNVFPEFYSGEIVDPQRLFKMAKRCAAQFRDFLINKCHRSLRQNLQLP